MVRSFWIPKLERKSYPSKREGGPPRSLTRRNPETRTVTYQAGGRRAARDLIKYYPISWDRISSTVYIRLAWTVALLEFKPQTITHRKRRWSEESIG